MTRSGLTREQRQNLFSAEVKLARVHSHIWNRLDSLLPEDERMGVLLAMSIVGTLYRLTRCEQEAGR